MLYAVNLYPQDEEWRYMEVKVTTDGYVSFFQTPSGLEIREGKFPQSRTDAARELIYLRKMLKKARECQWRRECREDAARDSYLLNALMDESNNEAMEIIHGLQKMKKTNRIPGGRYSIPW